MFSIHLTQSVLLLEFFYIHFSACLLPSDDDRGEGYEKKIEIPTCSQPVDNIVQHTKYCKDAGLKLEENLSIFYWNGSESVKAKDVKVSFTYLPISCQGIHPASDDTFYVFTNGSFYSSNEPNLIEKTKYCFDCISRFNQTLPTYCYSNDTPLEIKIGLIISILSLLLTLLVFHSIEELGDHINKSLVGYILLLAIALTASLYVKTTDEFQETACWLFAFFFQYIYLALFFWLNGMNIDIWLSFSGVGVFKNDLPIHRGKKFITLALCALGAPLLIVSLTMLLHFKLDKTVSYYPDISPIDCTLDRNQDIYFHGIIAVSISLNIILFTLTAIQIMKLKTRLDGLNTLNSTRKRETDQDRFFLYSKLFCLMGGFWFLEVQTWQTGEEIKFIVEFLDSLQGFAVFGFFVCTRKTLKLIQQKLESIVKSKSKATNTSDSIATKSEELTTNI